MLFDSGKYLFKIGCVPAKAGRAEQEYLLALDLLQKSGDLTVAAAFVRPEPDIQAVSCKGCLIRRTGIQELLLRQGSGDGIRQLLGVAGLTAEYDRSLHNQSFS